MTIADCLQAAFLGVIEGLTEFLPVSSTGHLILAARLMGRADALGPSFDIVIQLGAILAVCWVYREKLLHVALTLFREQSSWRFAVNILLAFVPAVAAGGLAHGYIKEHLFNPVVVSVSLILGGLAIFAIEKSRPEARYAACEDIPCRRALGIGIFQCLALVPGVSRAGATIMGALLLGAERKTAAEFSFFLAIPTMFAASAFDLYKERAALTPDGAALIAIGFAVAFLSALLVVKTAIGFIGRHGFVPFAWYRVAAGGLMLWVFWP